MRLALFGDPVAHSLSPAMQNAALAAKGIEGSYETRQVDPAGLASAVAEVRYGTLHGANITMPHKQAAFSLADRVEEVGLRAGSVNTLYREQGAVVGVTTDVGGVITVWDQAGLPTDAPVLILGGGGAAAAAALALEGRPLTLSARRPQTAVDLLARIRVEGSVAPWGTGLAGAVLVNATPLGMHGESLPAATLGDAAGLLDMAYADEATPATLVMEARGAPVADGYDMLIAQGAASFERWTRVAAPVDVMRTALEEELAQRRSDRR